MNRTRLNRWDITIRVAIAVACGCVFLVGTLTNIIPSGKPTVVAAVVLLAITGISSFVIAALPWSRLRFSLRTLLIVTTLVAVVLGCVAWAVR
jgi:hypothetical protein